MLSFRVGRTVTAVEGFLSGHELSMETGREPRLVVWEDLYSARGYRHFLAEVYIRGYSVCVLFSVLTRISESLPVCALQTASESLHRLSMPA